jgi:cytochrome P450
MFETNKKRHEFLRKLAGSAVSPQAVKATVSSLQETARATIESAILLHNDNNTASSSSSSSCVKMEDVCVDFTMDFTQKHVLGLSLPRDEVLSFERNSLFGCQPRFSWLPCLASPG